MDSTLIPTILIVVFGGIGIILPTQFLLAVKTKMKRGIIVLLTLLSFYLACASAFYVEQEKKNIRTAILWIVNR